MQAEIRCAVVRNPFEMIEYKTRDGVDILRFKINAHRLFDRLKLDIASDFPCIIIKLPDARLLDFRVRGIFTDFADKFFDQIAQRHNAGHAAIFVQNDGKRIVRLLHIAEQHVRLDRLRHKVRRLHRQFHDVFPASVLLPQIDLGVENADYLVGRAIADGIPGKPAAADDFFPHIVRILHPEDDQIRAMG